VLLLALGLGAVSAVTKFLTGIYAARNIGVFTRGQIRAGTMLTIRGEFSIVIAGLASSAAVVEPQLAPLAAAYVLVMAIFGPVMLRFLDPIMNAVLSPKALRTQTVPAVYVPPPTGADDAQPVNAVAEDRTTGED
jgi:CPA2 family monovalent cation:H+ antiporter-2